MPYIITITEAQDGNDTNYDVDLSGQFDSQITAEKVRTIAGVLNLSLVRLQEHLEEASKGHTCSREFWAGEI